MTEKIKEKRNKQISFLVTQKDHTVVKLEASRRGQSMRDFIMESIKRRLEEN